MATRSAGRAYTRSANRLRTLSSAPPLYPATSPADAPAITVPIATHSGPSTERPVPSIKRERTSRPISSVPNQCVRSEPVTPRRRS